MEEPAANFELFLDAEGTMSTAYNRHNQYFQKARDRMDRTFGLIKDHVKGSNVVDIGASPFYLLYLALAFGARECRGFYFANDEHPLKDREFIYSRYGAIHLHHANIETEDLPLEDNSVDVLTACEILEHCEHFPGRFASEIHRVLRPGGIVCLTVPNVGSIASIIRLVTQKNNYMRYRSDSTGRHKHEYTLKQLKAFLEYCKLDIVTAGYFPTPTSDLYHLRPAYRAIAATPGLRRYSPNLYIVGRQPEPKRSGALGPYPSILYDDSMSVEL